MNIVLIPNSYLPQIGGLEIAVNNIARELVKTGNKITVITGTSSCKYSKEEGTDGITVYRIPFFLPRIVTIAGYKRMVQSIFKSVLSPFITPISFFKFMRILKSINPDIVNLHYVGEIAVFCLLARRFLHFKFVVNLHGNDIDGYHKRSKFSRIITKKTLNIADRVLSNSNDILCKAKMIEPNIKDKSTVVGNGIYIEEFESSQKFNSPQKYILSIANFSYKKGQDILIHAFSIIHLKYPDITLIFAGDGQNLGKCIEQAERYGLSNSVKFLGRVEQSKIPSLLAGCEIFVLPSRLEPFGIVILEAMASKKPVIATKCGGPQEIITHLQNGLLVEPESPEAIAKGIELLLNKPEVSDALAKNGYNHVKENYTWPLIVQKYISEYKRLLM